MFSTYILDEVSSTNEIVKSAIDRGEPEGFVCRAYMQTGGYGRQGRSWTSPRGGLYQSLLLRPSFSRADLSTIALISGLAIRNALEQFLQEDGAKIHVKWPNDILTDAGKLSGISCEAHGQAVCLGIGVNVIRPAAQPVIEGGREASYLSDLMGQGFDAFGENLVDAVGNRVLESFERYYERWTDHGFNAFVEEYNEHNYLNGKNVRVVAHKGPELAQGRVESVDGEGCLVMNTKSGTVHLTSGEAHVQL